MREIKFRFYNQNGGTGMWSISNQTLEDIENQDSWQGGTGNWQRIAICQYTGLKDKNGKEIYEGDVVVQICTMAQGSTYEIKGNIIFYNDGQALFVIDDGTGEFPALIVDQSTEVEVIGNIYENPDLLESEVAK